MKKEDILKRFANLEHRQKQSDAQIQDLKYQLAQKDWIIEKFQKKLFGKTSERYISEAIIENQGSLFNQETDQTNSIEEHDNADDPVADADGNASDNTDIATKEKNTNKQKRRSPRLQLPQDLPQVFIHLEPQEDTSEYIKIGEQVTRILDIIPPQFRVINIVRPQYAPKPAAKAAAEQADKDLPILIAPLPWRAIDRGIPSSRLLAYVILQKFVHHLPYYRQIQIFKDIGITFKSNTINDWMAKVCHLLEPLYEKMLEYQFSKSYLQADETTIKVLKKTYEVQSTQALEVDSKKAKSIDQHRKKKVKKANKDGTTGYYWVYFDPLDKQVVFIHNPGRGRQYPAQHLEKFKGQLQTDGLSVYDAFDKLEYIELFACMAHIRRKFIDAISNDKKRAGKIVLLIQQLYDIERTARENNYSHQQRYDIRQEQAKPIMTKIKTYLDKLYDSNQVLPSSAIGQAVTYALGRWKYMERYLDNGAIEIDNNLVENSIRPIALGRKNYLFAGSERGAKWGAIYYTLIASAIRQGHNPLEYLADVIRRMPDTKLSQVKQLFPANWKPLDSNDQLNSI